MLFLPFKMDSNKSSFPLITLLICGLCAFVFWEQVRVDSSHYKAINDFCSSSVSKEAEIIISKLDSSLSSDNCYSILEPIRQSENPSKEIENLTNQIVPLGLFATKEDDFNYAYGVFSELYANYERKIPDNLTAELAYDPKEWDLLKMLTSTFSHADLMHLLGNLLFFYIFSASLELIVGSMVYIAFILVTAVGTSVAYSYAMIGVTDALPTIGLSGVVMAAIAALGIMMPGARICCFFWFIVIFRIIRIPALVLAIWYIGWDLYEMNQQGNDSYINYVAHVSGAAIGGVMGIFCFLFKSDTLKSAEI